MAHTKQFNTLTELVKSGEVGDYHVENAVKTLRAIYTNVYRAPASGPEGSPAAIIDTIATVFFTEVHDGKDVRVYRSSFTSTGRAFKEGRGYSHRFIDRGRVALPERVLHGEVARFSQKSLDSYHAEAVETYVASNKA